MRIPSRRALSIIASVALVTLILPAGAGVIRFEQATEGVGEAEYPDALGAFLEQQREASPGDVVEEGPARIQESGLNRHPDRG